jgi:hypothetical protein
MSGGHFDYKQHMFGEIAESIEELINDNGKVIEDMDGTVYHSPTYSKETLDNFGAAVLYVRTAAEMVQRIDYLVSGDDGEETFQKRWNENLAEIWKSTDR